VHHCLMLTSSNGTVVSSGQWFGYTEDKKVVGCSR
jgi:hypothetical protein